jgi:hypothetical protein
MPMCHPVVRKQTLTSLPSSFFLDTFTQTHASRSPLVSTLLLRYSQRALPPCFPKFTSLLLRSFRFLLFLLALCAYAMRATATLLVSPRRSVSRPDSTRLGALFHISMPVGRALTIAFTTTELATAMARSIALTVVPSRFHAPVHHPWTSTFGQVSTSQKLTLDS